MNVLLDTAPFLWLATDARELSATARAAFRDPANDAFLSAVSAWEIAVKHALGRLPLPAPPSRYVADARARHGIRALPLEEDAVLHLERLPGLHRDPFDRMLVCQALHHGLTILTPDADLRRYPVRTLW